MYGEGTASTFVGICSTPVANVSSVSIKCVRRASRCRTGFRTGFREVKVRQVELTDRQEREVARSSARSLHAFLRAHPEGNDEPFFLQARGEDQRKTVIIPSTVAGALVEALEELGEGRALVLDSLDEELSTQEAADLLQVSRPYLIENLLEAGEIPFHRVGNRRRIRLEDVMRYKRRREERRKATLRELSEEAQELEMGYE